jgi:hypothetical protein
MKTMIPIIGATPLLGTATLSPANAWYRGGAAGG